MAKKNDSLEENNNILSFDELYLSNLDEIIEEYNYDISSKNLDPEIIKLNFEIGITYFSIGKYILAKKYLEKAISFNPRLVNYFLGLSHHKKAKQIEKSGNFSSSKKNYDIAIKFYKKALTEKGILPNKKLLEELLDVVYEELGEKQNNNSHYKGF